MILQDYVRLLRRGWSVLVSALIIGGAAGVSAAAVTPPVFFAQATVLISVGGEATPGNLQQGADFAQQRASSYAGLATTSSVLDRASTALPGSDVEELERIVTAAARPETALIDINAEGGTGAAAADTANAVAAALARQVGLLDAPGAPLVQVTAVDPAREPEIAATPRPRNNLVIGLAVGLALGVMLLVLRHVLDDRIRTGTDVPRSRKLDTAVTLLPAPSRLGGPGRPDVRGEAFRHLRATLQADHRPPLTVTVAGVTAASDVLGVVEGLASSLGETGSAVVVVDLTQSSQTAARGRRAPALTAAAGGSEVMLDAQAALDAVQPGEDRNVYRVSAEGVGVGMTELFATRRGTQLLDELAKHFTYTLLACPPLLERADSSVAATLSDATLVVARAGRTSRSDCLQAFDLLLGVRATAVGVVVDDVRTAELRAS